MKGIIYKVHLQSLTLIDDLLFTTVIGNNHVFRRISTPKCKYTQAKGTQLTHGRRQQGTVAAALLLSTTEDSAAKACRV